MMMKCVAALAVLALFAGAPGVSAQDGVVALDVDITVVNPTLYTITINVRNFETVASFLLQVGLGGFGVPGATIVSFNDVSNVADTPNAIQIIGGNILSGGIVPGFTFVDFILLPQNCFLGIDCSDTSIFSPLIEFDVMVPMGTIPDDIFIGTPNGPDEPSLGTISFGSVDPILSTPTPEPVPAPVPTPAPAPFDARSISDPHMYGFNGQKFQFHGEPGKIYNLISDDASRLYVNALFAVAYTSGVTADTDTLVVSPYVAQGTWVKAVGVKIGAFSVEISTEQDYVEHPCTVPSCFQNGAVTVNGEAILVVGRYVEENDVTITLKNSKSFSRVELSSAPLTGKVDVVAPPSMWNVPPSDLSEFMHINLIVDRVLLDDGYGILGETISIRHDAMGNPIMESKGENGEGLLRKSAEEYAVSSLI